MKIITMEEECSCKETDVYPGGGKPDYLTDEQEVVKLYALYQRAYISKIRQFWGIHLNGKHVLKIQS